MRKALVSLGTLALLAAPAFPAFASGAAPTYVTSDPSNGATVQSAPSRVSVTFSEPLDPSSTLQVFDQCGRAVDSGDEQVLGSRIDVGIAQSPSGHYTAVYVAKGFAGATGETKGSISFHVTSGEACDGADHAGHDGHGTGGGADDGHDGHGDGDGDGHHGHGGGAGDGHDGHAGGSDDHTGGHHLTGGDHSGGAHSGRDHGAGGHGDGHGSGGEHGKGHGGRGHGGHHQADGGRDGGGDPQLASGRGGPGLAPTTTSVVIALGLSIVMGALGGWVLRVSSAS
ncbi:MAG TPA: copper resistance protein CopC [Actinomycetota bacterium]